MRRYPTIWRGSLFALLAPAALYLLAAAVLSAWPVNNAWQEPSLARGEDGVTIYVATNGIHAGLVMPVRAAGVDWSRRAPVTDLADPAPSQWLLFGWGERRFYLDTPTWRQVSPATVLTALAGSGETLVHVDHWRDFVPDDDVRPLRLRPDEYRRLAAFVEAAFAARREVVPGYGPRDVFYAGRGTYSAMATCNVWVGRALAYAGVRTGRWTPFAGSVMRWVPRLSGATAGHG